MKVMEKFKCPLCHEKFNYDIAEVEETLDLFITEKGCLHDINCDNCGELITIKFDLKITCVPYDFDDEDEDD